MSRALKPLLSGAPLGIAGVSVVLGVVLGSFAIGALGVAVAAAVALPRVLSRRRRLIRGVADASGGVSYDDLAALGRRLEDARRLPGLEELGIRAVEQFDGAAAKYRGLLEVLSVKFDPGELTHGRYAGSAGQVYRSVLDGLDAAASRLRSAGAFDVDHMRARRRVLAREASPSEAQRAELATLDERLALREKEVEAVRALLAMNERSLTGLAEASVSLARIETRAGRATLDAETAMRDLEDLARRAEQYELVRK